MEVRTIIKAVLFDLDGTLLDLPIDYVGIRRALGSLASEYGTSSDFTHIIEEIDRLAASLPHPKKAEFRRRCFSIIDGYELEAAGCPKLIEGASETLVALKSAGLKVAIVSRNSIECVQRSTKVSGLYGHVGLIVGRESTEKTKPDPSPLFYALKIFGIPPSQAFFIGDHRHDSMAAERAGMPFIMFNRRKAPYSGLQVDSLGDIIPIIKAHEN